MGYDIFLVIMTAGFGLLAAVPMLILPKLLAPKSKNLAKEAPYECGNIPSGSGRISFMMQYYSYLLMFVVFDVMAMFLFAWGVSYLATGLIGTIIISIFILVMLIPMAFTLFHAGRRELW